MILTLAALLVLSASLRSAAGSGRVIAVKSGDLALYDAAIRAFQERIDRPVDVLSLHDDPASSSETIDAIRSHAPSLVLAFGAQAASLVHAETPWVPLVFARVLAPERYGLAGETVTGVRQLVPPLAQLKLLRKLVPSVRRIGVPFNPDLMRGLVDEATAAARALDLSLRLVPCRDKRDAGGVLASVLDRVDALWVPPDPTFINPETAPLLLQLARTHRIPLMVHTDELVARGALVSLYVDDRQLGSAVAGVAGKVLSGARPCDVPVADPPESLAINLTLARELGVDVPREVLSQATLVVP